MATSPPTMRSKHDYEDKAMATEQATAPPGRPRPGETVPPSPGRPDTPPPTPPEPVEPVEPPDAEYQTPEDEPEDDAQEQESGKQPPLTDTGAKPAP